MRRNVKTSRYEGFRTDHNVLRELVQEGNSQGVNWDKEIDLLSRTSQTILARSEAVQDILIRFSRPHLTLSSLKMHR